MSLPPEAPIIHGTVSVATLLTGEVNFVDGTRITAIDQQLSLTSINPVSNGAFTQAVNSITSPPTQAFHVKLSKSSSTYTTTPMTFTAALEHVNTYDSSAPGMSSVAAPASGTYHIGISTSPQNPDDSTPVQASIIKNGTTLNIVQGEGPISSRGTYFLLGADAIQFVTSSHAPHIVEVTVTLLMPGQSI